MRTVPLKFIAYSVPVGITDYSSYTLEDTCIAPAGTLHLTDCSYFAPLFFHILYGVRLFQMRWQWH
jgi:succinate dehydrogenase/fumarate reductase cytochrome b subunit